MKKIAFKSIRGRLTFWFLFLALTPLIVGILITFGQQKKSIEKETFNRLISIRDLKVQQLEGWLDERIGDLHVIAEDFEIRTLENIFDKESKSTEDIKTIEIARELLNRYLRNYNDYEELFIIGSGTGAIELSSKKNSEKIDKSKELYFTAPLESGKIYINEIYYSKNLKRPQMTISIPIFYLEHNKHIIGILVARIDLDNSLYKLLANRVGLGETGETLIINKNVVALNELRWHENAPLNLKVNAIPAIKAANGETGIIEAIAYNKEKILAAYTYIPRTNWGFVAKQDLSELNSPIRTLMRNFAYLILISGLVVILIVLWLIKRISKPIIDMNIATQKIKRGDYTVRTVVNSRDELASLSDSINEMTSSIESRDKTQKGVADISEIMIGQSSMQEFGSTLLKQLMNITDANMSTFYILNEVNMEYEHFASIGANEDLLKPFSAENPEGEFGNAISGKSFYYLRDIPQNTTFNYKTTAGNAIPKEIITIPVIVDDIVVALISLVNIKEFSKESYNILKLAWASINTFYSNLMASERTRIFAEQLSRTNEQLEAQTEELQEQSEELQNQTEELQRTSEELQEQNVELEAQRNQVESANQMKSEFLSNMSHELRTPLNSIMALSRVLLMQAKSKLNEDENDYLEIIERNGKHLLSLINEILDLSKIEAGKMDIMPKSISVRGLLQLTKENIYSLAQEKELEINLNIPEDLVDIETDESRLHQVLLNIVGNAVKFTEKGSVDISATQDHENTYINVKDSGIGISKDVLPHIFEEFRQADGSSSRKYEGTGLGLAIAKKMIQILGGAISVESKLEEGSTFTITIPTKWPEELPNANTISNYLQSSQPIISEMDMVSEKTDFSKSGNNGRILMVEDNQEATIQVKAVLEQEGFVIDIANNGQQALDYIQHTIPDGIILDLMMPGIDGFEVLEKIRIFPETKNIPVLILTAKDLTKKDLANLSSNNIQQLIQKGNVDIDGLIRKVKLMLGYKEKSQQDEDKPEPKRVKVRKSNSGIPNILVIEDNPDNMTTINAILKDKYKIFAASDGNEGLAIAESIIPDLILLDISLPEMTGLDVMKKLRANNNTRKIPVIAITAQAMKGDKEKILEASFDEYIAKPINPEELLEEIEKLLSR